MLQALNYGSAALIGAVALFSAASAQEVKTYEFEDFDRIDVATGIVLVADIGEPQSIIAKTDSGDFSDLKIKVRDGELVVYRKLHHLRWHAQRAKYKILVTTPTVRSVSASSGAQASITNVASTEFNIDLSSGARVNVTGKCNDCDIELSSGARLDGKEFICETVEIDVSSGGNGVIHAEKSINAEASSGGKFVVYGSPDKVAIDRSSGGRIQLAGAE